MTPLKNYVFYLIFLSFYLNSSAQNSSILFQEWKSAQTNNSIPTLPNFAYVGYKSGEESTPLLDDYTVFDVTDYGAIANDNISDKQAIMAAINAAEDNNSGIVFFPPGEFLVNESSDETGEIILISKSNIILKGSGSGPGGTVLKQTEPTPPSNPNLAYTSPYLFRFEPKDIKTNLITEITSNASRETFEVEVADPSALNVGQIVRLELHQLRTDGESLMDNLLNEEFGNQTIVSAANLNNDKEPRILDEIRFQEIHEITAINGSKITFKEPIHRTIDKQYNWVLHTYNYIENVGVEDIKYTGYVPLPFNHHAEFDFPGYPKQEGWKYDSGWSAIKFSYVLNGWIKNNTFNDLSNCARIVNSTDCSALQNVYTSSFTNPNYSTGHTFISTEKSSYCLIGKNYDQSAGGVHHTCGFGANSIGNVVWRSHGPENDITGFEAHANQPRCNLIDQSTGSIGAHFGGGKESLPNHLKYLTIWNFKGAVRSDNYYFYSAGEWASKVIEPIVSGFISTIGSLSNDPNDTMAMESLGTHVDEESLYEEQLKYRLSGIVPNWVNETKNNILNTSPSNKTTIIGKEIQLTAGTLDNTSPAITWTSSDPSIAEVNNNGLVFALANGSVVITATTANGISDSSNINIETLSLNTYPNSVELTQTATVKVNSFLNIPEETATEVQWSSSDESIASVDSDGNITGIKPGETTVSVSANANNQTLTATLNVTVSALPNTYTETFENMSGEGWFVDTVKEGDNNFTWFLNAKLIKGSYIGSNQKQIYNGAGKSLIKTYDNIPGGICDFEVTCKNQWGNTNNERKLELFVNGISKGTNAKTSADVYTFSIKDMNIEGEFTLELKNISEIPMDGDTGTNIFIDDLSWTTFAPSLLNLTTNENSIGLYQEQTIIPETTIYPSSAKVLSETWTSNDTSIATVNEYGEIKGISEGTTTVTVSKLTNLGTTNEISIEINVINISESYTETFESLDSSGGGTWYSVANGNNIQTLDNNFVWDIYARAVQGNYIESGQNQIYTKNGRTIIKSHNTIPGGIKNFEVTCRNYWGDTSNERKLELIINDNPAKTYTNTHAGSDIYTFRVDDINVLGDFTLELKNISETPLLDDGTNIFIDNLSWNSYTNILSNNSIERTLLTAYPNPFKTKLQLEFSDLDTCTIDFINMFGTIVYSKTIDNRNNKVILSPSFEEVPPGIYTVVISNHSKHETIRVIRRK